MVVVALQDGATTELKKGDCLKTVNGVDVTAKGLEEVMDIIASTEQFVVLEQAEASSSGAVAFVVQGCGG